MQPYAWRVRRGRRIAIVNARTGGINVVSGNLSNLTRSAAAAAALVCIGGAAQADGLGALAGSWSGGGTIHMTNGASERLRCRANYNVDGGGAAATQDLRCASDSYRVDIQSNVSLSGTSISGRWTETSRGVSGQVSGRLNGSDLTAQIVGPGFAAGISIGTRGNNQSLLLRVNGGDVASVSLNLKRN